MSSDYEALDGIRRRVRRLRAETLERMAKGAEHRAYDELVGRGKVLLELEQMISDDIRTLNGGDDD